MQVCGCRVCTYSLHTRSTLTRRVSCYSSVHIFVADIPIRNRWLADYNLPAESLQLRTLKVASTKKAPSKIAHLIDRLRSAEDVNPSGFSDLCEQLLKLTNEFIGDDSGPQRAQKQPRWPKARVSADVCFICGKPLTEEEVHCPHNRVRYHVQCLRVPAGAGCSICLQDLQPVTVQQDTVPSSAAGTNCRHRLLLLQQRSDHLHLISRCPLLSQLALRTKVGDNLSP